MKYFNEINNIFRNAGIQINEYQQDNIKWYYNIGDKVKFKDAINEFIIKDINDEFVTIGNKENPKLVFSKERFERDFEISNPYEGDDTDIDEGYVRRNTRDEKYNIEYNTDYIEFEVGMRFIDENDVEWIVVEVKNNKVLLLSENKEFNVFTQEELNDEIDLENFRCIYDEKFYSKDDYERATGQKFPEDKDFLTEDEDDEEDSDDEDDEEDIPEEIKDIVSIIEDMESISNKDRFASSFNVDRALEKLAKELYNACIECSGRLENYARDHFEQKLFDAAIEDDNNAQYRKPDYLEDEDLDNLSNDFYNNESSSIISYINSYYGYSIGYILNEIETKCKEFFEEEQTEYTAQPDTNDYNINDISTIDENFDPSLSENQDMIEIYNIVTETDPNRITDEELNSLFNTCRNCGYGPLEYYIDEIESEIRDGYVNDTDNWEEKYDYDATYEYCANLSLSELISEYAYTNDIEEFKNNIKEIIEDEFDYQFKKAPKETIYDGDDTEIDESVEPIINESSINKLIKLHKEHPTTDIRDIAKEVSKGNIEEYISLMKQYFEKFEK